VRMHAAVLFEHAEGCRGVLRDQVPGAELRALGRRATVDAGGRVIPAAS
jgi:hypothetical protein